MRKVVGKALIEVNAIVPLGGIEKVEQSFRTWMRNCNMHGMAVEVLIEPDFKDVEDEEV